jgi:hypothetical protein
MPTLYLHIGHCKTGSSWIQSSFQLSHDSLKEKGIVYPLGHGIYLDNSETLLHTAGNAIGMFETEAEFIAALSANRLTDNRSLLLSSEDIFRVLWKENIALELALLHGFDQVKVLLFIRDPVGYAVSHWQQVVKENTLHRLSLEAYFSIVNTLEGVKAIVDQMNSSKGVALTVLNYSRCKDRLLEEVAAWLDVPTETLVVPAVTRVNRSMTPSELLLVQHLERYIPAPIPSHIARDLCTYLPNVKTPKLLPSLVVQEALWARLLPVITHINAHIPQEQGYQCDICPPDPELENVVFSIDQIDCIAKSLGTAFSPGRLGIENLLRWNSTIYYKDTLGDYNEVDKVTKKVNSASENLSFKLRGSKKNQSIRFDPLMDYVVVHLCDIQARLDGETIVTPLTVTSNAYRTENGVYYFDTQAPYFFIDFEGGIECEMDELVVSFRYEQYGVEALDLIAEAKSKAIASVNSDRVPLREKRHFFNPWQLLKAIVNTKWL